MLLSGNFRLQPLDIPPTVVLISEDPCIRELGCKGGVRPSVAPFNLVTIRVPDVVYVS